MSAKRPEDGPAEAPDCLSDARLKALLEGSEDAAGAERHIETCGVCRGRLEALAGLDSIRLAKVTPGEVRDASLNETMSALRRQVPYGAGAGSSLESLSREEILEPAERSGLMGQFAGYDIVRLVASGGMGVVYEGFDRALQRKVAIKVLAPALAASATARARFLREARAAAAINHEHVVAIHAVGEKRGLPYLVMPFVRGLSLQARLETGGPLGAREVLRIGSQAAHGLAAAHAQGLIHRDVKPGNILIEDGSERVKLTDFGLARAADATDVTRPGVIAGTPEFMAPEQARGERLDPRADLFGLGTVLYTIASGESPFAAESPLATLRKVCERTPVPLHELDAKHPRDLSDLVARLMAKNRDDRYPDAVTAARAIEEALARMSVRNDPVPDVAPGTAPVSVGPKVRRRRTLAWAAVTLMACLLAAVGIWVGQRDRSDLPFRHRDARRVQTASTNLSTLLERRRTGDVIELNWDGPRFVPPVRTEGLLVHLRAAKGRHPVILHRSKSVPWLLSEAPVRLEGIEIRSETAEATVTLSRGQTFVGPGSAEWPRRPLGRLARTHEVDCQLVVVRGTNLTLINCRLASASTLEDPQVPILLMDCPRVNLWNSEIQNPGGPAISWRTADGNRLSLSNCALVARSALLTSAAGDAMADFEFERCTFAGSFLIAAVSGAERLRGRGADNVFSIRKPLLIGPGAALPGRHRWRGVGNVYERMGADFGFSLPPSEERSLSLDLGLDDRVRAKLGQTNFSAAADLVLGIEAQARIGRPVGMDPKSVGPGRWSGSQDVLSAVE